MLWTLPVAFAFAPTAAPAPSPPLSPLVRAVDADESDRSTAEGVEVLRRLLVRAMQGAGSTGAGQPGATHRLLYGNVFGGYRAGAGDFPVWSDVQKPPTWSTLGAAPSNARGFHLPGAGATFTIDVTVPVELVAGSAEAEDPPQEDDGRDEWDTVRDAVRKGDSVDAPPETLEPWPGAEAGGFGDPWAQSAVMQLDAKAVEAATDAVLASLARHGHRLQLSPDESITVALKMEGLDLAESSLALPSEGVEYDRAMWIAYAQAMTSGITKAELTRRIVIQVPVSALGKGAGDAASLRGRARIHRY